MFGSCVGGDGGGHNVAGSKRDSAVAYNELSVKQ